jgi:hypothetical protein
MCDAVELNGLHIFIPLTATCWDDLSRNVLRRKSGTAREPRGSKLSE